MLPVDILHRLKKIANLVNPPNADYLRAFLNRMKNEGEFSCCDMAINEDSSISFNIVFRDETYRISFIPKGVYREIHIVNALYPDDSTLLKLK